MHQEVIRGAPIRAATNTPSHRLRASVVPCFASEPCRIVTSIKAKPGTTPHRGAGVPARPRPITISSRPPPPASRGRGGGCGPRGRAPRIRGAALRAPPSPGFPPLRPMRSHCFLAATSPREGPPQCPHPPPRPRRGRPRQSPPGARRCCCSARPEQAPLFSAPLGEEREHALARGEPVDDEVDALREDVAVLGPLAGQGVVLVDERGRPQGAMD